MKTKTVFSEFQLYADEEARFFEYCLENGQYFVRPLVPYLKNECFEIYRKENMKHVFFAVVQIKVSGRQLLPNFIDVAETSRQYKLLGEVLAYSEKVNIRHKGCVYNAYGWRVFALDGFGDVVDMTKKFILNKKTYIEQIDKQSNLFRLCLRFVEAKPQYVYFEQVGSDFKLIDEQWLADTEESFQRQKLEDLNKNWQRLENELF